MVKRAPSTMKVNNTQASLRGIPLVPLTEEIIMKARQDFNLPTPDKERLVQQDQINKLMGRPEHQSPALDPRMLSQISHNYN